MISLSNICNGKTYRQAAALGLFVGVVFSTPTSAQLAHSAPSGGAATTESTPPTLVKSRNVMAPDRSTRAIPDSDTAHFDGDESSPTLGGIARPALRTTGFQAQIN